MTYDNVNPGNVWFEEQPDDLLTNPFTFKNVGDPAEWVRAFKSQTSSSHAVNAIENTYGRKAFVFAARWARRMENWLEAHPGGDIGEVCGALAQEVDESEDMGVSGVQQSYAKGLLYARWKYGDRLREIYRPVGQPSRD